MQSGFKELQAHLADAKRKLESGELDRALEQADLALAIDPEFLAARALREKISDAAKSPVGFPAPGVPNHIPPPEISGQIPAPHISVEGFAQFEERARRRRVERRLERARTAIADGQFGDARDALHEVEDLAPERTELGELHAWLADAESCVRPAARRRRWLAAAAACAVVALGAGWVGRDSIAARLTRNAAAPAAAAPVGTALPALDLARAFGDRASLVEPPADEPLDLTAHADFTESVDPVAPGLATVPAPSLSSASVVSAAPGPRAVVAPSAPLSDASAVLSSPVAPPLPGPPVTVVPPAASAPPVALMREPPAVQALDSASLARPEPVSAVLPASEDRLVRETLQRYRIAYDDLDARSAQSVWPSVDEPALARAFDGLESQRLTFDDCAVNVQGAVATATCRGSASYVPRQGTREARSEPRVWTFTLRKVGARWVIDAARVAR